MRTDGPVVVALDGSAHSATTLKWGLAEAQLRAAPVVLVSVVKGPPGPPVPEWYPSPHHPFDGAAAYLDLLRERETARRPGVQLSTRVLHGPEVPALRSLSDDAQLLVVGARGRAGRDPVGRVSGHLAAQAGCPVAVVRERDLRTGDGSAPVVTGVDGSQPSRTAAAIAAQEAAMRGCPLLVVHGGHTRAAVAPSLGASRGGPGSAVTDEVVAHLSARHPGLDVRADVVEQDPVEALVARSRGAALVVLGSRGLGAVRGTLLGSVSGQVLRRTTATVLIVHGATAAPEA